MTAGTEMQREGVQVSILAVNKAQMALQTLWAMLNIEWQLIMLCTAGAGVSSHKDAVTPGKPSSSKESSSCPPAAFLSNVSAKVFCYNYRMKMKLKKSPATGYEIYKSRRLKVGEKSCCDEWLCFDSSCL